MYISHQQHFRTDHLISTPMLKTVTFEQLVVANSSLEKASNQNEFLDTDMLSPAYKELNSRSPCRISKSIPKMYDFLSHWVIYRCTLVKVKLEVPILLYW